MRTTVEVEGHPCHRPIAIRGPGTGYLDAVARVAARDGRGAAIRLSFDDFSVAATFERELDAALSSLALAPEDVDVFLDAESLILVPPAEAAEPVLIATLREALRAVKERAFRCVVFAASSVPENLPAQPDDAPLVFERRELRIWKELVRSIAHPLVRFGDYAVWHPRQDDTGSSGIAPARVRVPVGEQQVYFRSAAAEYRALCRRVVRYPGISELPRSRGLNAVRECAAGYGPPGNATSWVARDTNMHIETTMRAVEDYLSRTGRLKEIELASSRSAPWLQESLVGPLEGRTGRKTEGGTR